MADKILLVDASTGLPKEKELVVVSAGAGSAGTGVALDSNGKIDASVLPSGVGADTESIPAFENLAAGDFVNLFSDAGTTKVRKADAANARQADGFVLASVTAPASATVYRRGLNNQATGLTPGVVHFLSATVPGGEQTTAPTTAGHLCQRLGTALNATSIDFERVNGIIRG